MKPLHPLILDGSQGDTDLLRQKLQRSHHPTAFISNLWATVLPSLKPKLVAEGDPQLLRVLLTNLLGNAWKYTGKTTAAKIEFGAVRNAEGITDFFVRDNGAGFDMAYADKLFGAFQRLHTAAEFPGTGIGLATVQRIIHRHGGKIRGEGVPHQGATFYFSLPAIPNTEVLHER